MNLFKKNELESLLRRQQGQCISLYMPTFRAGRQVEQNRIRFKNLLRKADEQLVQTESRDSERNRLLTPAHKLLEDSSYWRRQRDGLAAFLCSGEIRHYRVPFKFDELVVVSDQFHLKPLIPLLAGSAQFYLLALSKNSIRLFEGSRFEIGELDVESIPTSLAEALKYDNYERQLQFHTGSPGRGGKRDAVFFGTGAGDPNVKEKVLRYFREVDRGLRELLRDRQAPLVLAGVEYLFPIFREASKYPHLMEEGIPGNPEKESAGTLHEKAWKVVEPSLRSVQLQAAERYAKSAGNGQKLASSDLERILPAALQSRIESLFVAVGVQSWGKLDKESGKATLHEKPEAGDRDLLDFAAIQAFTSGAKVYAVKPDQVPGGGAIAAVFRY